LKLLSILHLTDELDSGHCFLTFYRFKANYPGTHFWHAHSGLQRSDGIFGAFVVRQADDLEPHYGLYQHDLPEHTMIVNDWLEELTENKFARHHHAGGDNRPKSILINGNPF
jgi:FtsP/CotA-like multicopper oxidase with cupredoxin domain